MGFSENLKSFRKVFKLSQEKFAKEIGISRSQVANYETSASEPNLTTLKRIADFFYVPIDSLLADYYDYINNPVGCFYIKSNLFDHMQRSNKIEIYTFNYRFGAFKTEDNNIMEYLYIGSLKQPLIKYLLDKSYSYGDFKNFTDLIEAQIGWKFVDKADTNTYIIVDDPQVPGKYYHIYGNYMSGMKMSEIYQNEFFDKFKRNMAFDEVGLRMYLADLYDGKTISNR